MTTETALQRAIEEAGSQKALADRIAAFLNRPTISQQTISLWLQMVRDGKPISADYCPAIEHATNGKVTREELRPDIFAKRRSA